jgi:hypothetical protein
MGCADLSVLVNGLSILKFVIALLTLQSLQSFSYIVATNTESGVNDEGQRQQGTQEKVFTTSDYHNKTFPDHAYAI